MEDYAIVISSGHLFQIAAVLLTGLLAGLFYGYDCSVIRGLGNLTDREYLRAFQSINRAILNPYFISSFMGCLVVLPLATWIIYKGSSAVPFYFLMAATIIYAIAVFGVTIFGNIPLNNELDKVDLTTASNAMIRDLRVKFEKSWNTLHHIRTCASILAFLLTIVSLVKIEDLF